MARNKSSAKDANRMKGGNFLPEEFIKYKQLLAEGLEDEALRKEDMLQNQRKKVEKIQNSIYYNY